MTNAKDQVAEVIERALLAEVNGGELEPIWQIYKPEGVALVIRQALADAGLLMTDHVRTVIEAAEWMVGDGSEELGGPFHEGAFRSLERAVLVRRSDTRTPPGSNGRDRDRPLKFCPKCSGTGKQANQTLTKCTECRGTGYPRRTADAPLPAS